jgi:Skp family chaperone for outer membrane proteins
MNARRSCVLSLAAAVAVCLPLAAQDKESAPLPIAVLNLDLLFKEDPDVVQGLADLKQEAAEIDEKIKLRQSEVEAVASDARKAQPGSQEQRRLAQEAAKLDGELKQYVNREREAVRLKEAKLYLTAYRDVESVVKEYCKEKGIKLVIRQQTTSLDENQTAQEIVKALNRLVIYEDGLDITDDIKKRLKAKDKNP